MSGASLRAKGSAIRRHRLGRAWTQDDLARAAGVRPYTVSALESGRRSARPTTIRRLAEALGVDVSAIAEIVEAGS